MVKNTARVYGRPGDVLRGILYTLMLKMRQSNNHEVPVAQVMLLRDRMFLKEAIRRDIRSQY